MDSAARGGDGVTDHRRRAHLALGVLFGVGLLPIAGTGPAAAHSELVDSTPASGEVLEVGASEVVLTFDSEVTDESTFTVEDSDGMTVGRGDLDLEVIDRNVLRGRVEVDGPGEYVVHWSVTDARDGDTTSGEFTFTVGRAEPAASTRPDTALGRDAPPAEWLGTAGLGLLVAAVCAALWVRIGQRAKG